MQLTVQDAFALAARYEAAGRSADARRVYEELSEDNIWGYAAQLAYYLLFALFPFFMFLAALLA